MALDAAGLAELREWVGSTPDDADLNQRYERLDESIHATALQVLRSRHADMITNPTKFAADGDASWDYTANLKALRSQITELEALIGADVGVVTVSHMTLYGARR